MFRDISNIPIVAIPIVICLVVLMLVAPQSWWGNYNQPGISLMEKIALTIIGPFMLYCAVILLRCGRQESETYLDMFYVKH